MKYRLIAALVVLLLASSITCAQLRTPPETKNAALRYWLAFAEIQDPPSDDAVKDLLEKTLRGDADWDEAKLGPILGANTAALATLARATKLPDCDWGLEYSQGTRASIAYVPRARVLARLNTLRGMRYLAKKEPQSALDAWLTGVRFSQDVARGGTLIFALVGRSTLLENLHVLTKAAGSGAFSDAQKREISAALRTLPEDGFDWRLAWGTEGAALDQQLRELQAARNPSVLYESVMGKPAPESGIPVTEADLRSFREYMLAVQGALRLPPDKASERLDELEPKRARLSKVIQSFVPNPKKVNEARGEIVTERAVLLKTVTKN